MIRSFYYTKEKGITRDLPLEDIRLAYLSDKGLLWVDMIEASDEDFIRILVDIFHFHPLAIEDCQTMAYQTPKVDQFTNYLFIIAHAVVHQSSFLNPQMQELDIFLGSHFLVTSTRFTNLQPTQIIWKRIERDERLLEHGPDFLCHAVLDALTDEYMPIIDVIDDAMDELEDVVIFNPKPENLERILNIKHSILTYRRIISPLREVMNRLSRDDYLQIEPANRIYYRDIYDHLVHIWDLLDSVRDIVSGTLETYLSSTSNRLNEVMKALTIVSTVFLPLSFIAGVYGMNFHFMPEIGWKYGYLFFWGIIFIAIILMLWYFKRRGWF